MADKIVVYTLAIPTVGEGATCRTMKEALSQIADDLECLDVGDQLVIRKHEMTQEDFDAMPEWPGY